MNDTKKQEKLLVDKSKMLANNGVPITQSLFLEIGYSDFAIYTLKDQDYEYKGKLYPSIKRLYLECEDTTEYEFATTYFLGWAHWQRIASNVALQSHVETWRAELALKLRARAARTMISLANKGWEEKRAGRPSKAEREAESKRQKAFEASFEEDYTRLRVVS